MKKFLSILFVLGLLFAFSACEKADDEDVVKEKDNEIEALKEKVDELETKVEDKEEDSEDKDKSLFSDDKEEKEEPELPTVVDEKDKMETPPANLEEAEVIELDVESFIEVLTPTSGKAFGPSDEPIVFTGKVSPNTEAIEVTVMNNEGIGNFYQLDKYTLKNFSEGDTTFTYKAKKDWGNLEILTNRYTFKAYFADGTEAKDTVELFYSDSGPFLDIWSPSNESTFHEAPIEFTGEVGPGANKITVSAVGFAFVGDEGNTYEDVYELQNFKSGDSKFTYRASLDYDNLGYGTNDYNFTAYFDDGTILTKKVRVFFIEAGAEMGKPVIYLYPEKAGRVSVNVEPTGGVSVSEPALEDGWEVYAWPNGRIYNVGDHKYYPYLFWEGFASGFETPSEGFVIAKDEVSSFFDESLSELGLVENEIADFKEFWVPRLSEKPYYFITYIDQDAIDRYAPLEVSPQPDSVIRVFFDYKGLDKFIRVTPQKLEAGVRDGFTVVEWGGRLYR